MSTDIKRVKVSKPVIKKVDKVVWKNELLLKLYVTPKTEYEQARNLGIVEKNLYITRENVYSDFKQWTPLKSETSD